MTGWRKRQIADAIHERELQEKPFRRWLSEKWMQHCDEIYDWTGKSPDYPLREYFNRYRWFLKALYRKEEHHE